MSNAPQRGIIALFARNSVAANLLMGFILIMGTVSYFLIQRQMFPNFEINYIQVTASYPGVSAQEIEESILIKVEESLKDVTEVKKAVTDAYRGGGVVTLEIDTKANLMEVLDKVKQRVDGVASFPKAMEPIKVTQIEFKQDVIGMVLSGNTSLPELKTMALQIEKELLQLGDVSLVEVSSPPDEIGIEIHPDELRTYDLTLDDVVTAIQKYSANFSAGQVRTSTGLVSIRIENQYYNGFEFRQIPVKLGANGSKVLLGDIAVIKDEFTEGQHYFKYSGQNGIYLTVKATKTQNMVPVANTVKKFIEAKNAQLPHGIQLHTLMDMTYYLNARLDMMLKNLLQGAVLVALLLTIFLRFRLAMWVMVGLPVCFLGAVMLMPLFDVSINIITLFAFIMVLGIVVDDAIVIGESVYTEVEKEGGGVTNVVRGAQRVATPATFGVLTTIAVFVPFLFSTGPEKAFFYGLSIVVIFCLIFSLIESKLILPAHLAHTTFTPIKENSLRARFNKQFFRFVDGPYKRCVSWCVEWRWSVVAGFIAVLVISVSMLTAGHVRMIPSPKVPSDFPLIKIEMNSNVSDDQTINALLTLERIVQEVNEDIRDEYGQPVVRDMMTINTSRTQGMIILPLVDESVRPVDAFELSKRWREKMPTIVGLKSIVINDNVTGGEDGDEFGYLLYGPDMEVLNAAGRALISQLQLQTGLYDISSSMDTGSREVQLSLKPVAYDLGLDLATIAGQVGGSFYGGEAQRILRNTEEVRVMVRYPKLTREAFSSLRYTLINTPEGKKVMLGDVVNIVNKPGINQIRRENGYRTVYVYGSIDESQIEPDQAVKNIEDNVLPKVQSQFPSVVTELGGTIEEQQKQKAEQIVFFIAGMITVYILLAIPLKSYAQPFIIMSVIPFSLTGAIWGHYFYGLDMSMMSTFGLIAAAGVVINDSLVMTDYVNQIKARCDCAKQAVVEAGCARFRAITLTSITTFFGVLPIMFETSLQAAFVKPMAVALGFAVMYATVVTLILVPCLYVMLEDIGKVAKKLWRLYVPVKGHHSS
ncbi:acriflavin resistance protein [Vibrio sp. 10N.286.49.C2]|uniref:efflux RND transporter permease subunit n=1 Tax=unclassified Vibrio TaxID=2614977 RepID=UPI000C819C2C|nr:MULTISPECIES: efflux RND transporter permease subunit [unclassified Vibrio]PMH42845.1 acriflavin resistance protein [Vibrio sp. 10N.286.49.C2]PMH53816.1 acriflavin resistance protein [Vibrio sp. 10N.286.49.B1]PMH82900.1 acriflavin resistance protein [Vibrio sp. 10N.286.48.B7]